MSYIGSKINVTTVTGFQYDGILTNINRHEATIEMQKVRQVAAAGQPVKDGAVFDFIVLKSDDIKDLYVYEQRQAAEPPAPTYSDPAIVSAKPATSANASASTSTLTSTPSYYGQTAKETQGIQFGSTAASGASGISFGGAAEQPRPAKPQPIGKSYSEQQLVVNSESITSTPPSTFAAAVAATAASIAPTFTPPSQKTPRGRPSDKDVPIGSATRQQQQQPPQQQQRLHPKKSPTALFVPKRDFDFEQSNQLFNKDQVAAEVAPVLTGDGPYYNKASSFFDNISSEATAAAGAPGGQEPERTKSEKSWNVETFGQPFVRGSGNSRRGSRGGRGSQRGAGGGHQRFMHHNATGSFPS